MPRSAALRSASPEELCYDRPMKEAVSPDVAKSPGTRRKPRTKKYIITPLTGEEISRGVGVTKKDAALVRKVLLELGYIKHEGKGKNCPDTARRKKVKISKG